MYFIFQFVGLIVLLVIGFVATYSPMFAGVLGLLTVVVVVSLYIYFMRRDKGSNGTD